MKVYKEIDLKDFTPWSGAKARFDDMSDDELEMVQQFIEECYPDGIEETTLNDILWFEDELIGELIGRELFVHDNEEEGEDE